MDTWGLVSFGEGGAVSNRATSPVEGGGNLRATAGVEAPEEGLLVRVGVLTPVLVPDFERADTGFARRTGLGRSTDRPIEHS